MIGLSEVIFSFFNNRINYVILIEVWVMVLYLVLEDDSEMVDCFFDFYLIDDCFSRIMYFIIDFVVG